MEQRTFKYPEHQPRNLTVGIWTITYTALRARAVRTGGRDEGLGAEARTGVYVTGASGTGIRGFLWTDTPDPPQYVKDAALAAVKRRRKEHGLPV